MLLKQISKLPLPFTVFLMASCTSFLPSSERTTFSISLLKNSVASSPSARPFVVVVKRNFLPYFSPCSRAYATMFLIVPRHIRGSPPKKSASSTLRLPLFAMRKSMAFLAVCSAHKFAGGMISSFVCEAVAAAHIAVVTDMYAQRLYLV